MSRPSKMKPEGSPPAKLVTISESEIVELAQFIASQSGRESASVERPPALVSAGEPGPRSADSARFWIALRRKANSSAAFCLFHKSSASSSKHLLIVGSSCFYVDERYRGSGGLVFLRFSQLGRKWPLFGNSANADAARCGKLAVRFPSPIPIMSCWACCTGKA